MKTEKNRERSKERISERTREAPILRRKWGHENGKGNSRRIGSFGTSKKRMEEDLMGTQHGWGVYARKRKGVIRSSLRTRG